MTMSMSARRLGGATAAPAATIDYSTSSTASGEPVWASEGQATITPGVQMYTDGAQCPNALAARGTPVGERVYSFGNSSLRAGVTQLSPKYGTSIGDSAAGGSKGVYTVTPGVPGESGSGFRDLEGDALGTLSTPSVAPVPLSNGVGDLPRQLAHTQASSGISGLALVPGTRPFSSSL